jgi:hypothetical protein
MGKILYTWRQARAQFASRRAQRRQARVVAQGYLLPQYPPVDLADDDEDLYEEEESGAYMELDQQE